MWRKRLRTASFRNVRFRLTNADSSFGRRTVNHAFPKRDEPYTEDLGRKAKEFSLEGFIIGDDYLRLRDRLIAACEKPGPGRLVHPYYGKRNVVCTAIEVRENSSEGGIARFVMSFREAGKLRFPAASKNAKGLLALFGNDALDAQIQSFTDNFSVAGQPQALVDTCSDKVEDFTEALDNSTSFITRNSDELADLAFSIRDLGDDVEAIIMTPSVLADRVMESLQLVGDAVTDKREAVNVFKSLFNFGSDDSYSSRTTTTRANQTRNLRQLNSLVKIGALGYAAQLLADLTFESIEDANAIKDSFFDLIDEEMGLAHTSDDVYQALDQLKVQIHRAVPPVDEDLASIIEITPTSTQNSIVLAYGLYGNLDKEGDIISRNFIRHPGFISGGQKLKVLSDV